MLGRNRVKTDVLWAGILLVGNPLTACTDSDRTNLNQDDNAWIAQRCEVRRDGTFMVGGLYSFSGGAATGDSVEKAMLLAVDRINAGGGIQGQPLGLISCDHRLNSGTARAQIKELADHPGIIGIVGPDTSQVAEETVAQIRASQILAIGPSLGAPDISFLNDDGYLYRTRPSNKLVGDIASAIFATQGVQRVFGIYRDDLFGRGNREAFEQAFVGSDQEVSAADYLPFETDFAVNAVDKAVAYRPEGVYVVGFPMDRTAVLRRLAVAQWEKPPVILLGATVAFDASAGDFVHGVRVIIDTEIDTPERAQFTRDYRATWGDEPGLFSDDAFDATMNLALAAHLAEHAGTGPGIRDALARTHSGQVVLADQWEQAVELMKQDGEVDYQGLTGPIDFDDRGDPTGHTMTEAVVVDGTQQITACWTATLGSCD